MLLEPGTPVYINEILDVKWKHFCNKNAIIIGHLKDNTYMVRFKNGTMIYIDIISDQKPKWLESIERILI